jgi:hypothetical protein
MKTKNVQFVGFNNNLPASQVSCCDKRKMEDEGAKDPPRVKRAATSTLGNFLSSFSHIFG